MVPHDPETIEKLLYEAGKRKADDDAAHDDWGDWSASSPYASSSSGIVTAPPATPPPTHLREGWANLDIPFDSRKWKEVLDYHGVDLEAQQVLFLLCQHSPEGARAANSLLARFVKAASNQREITNPSAFITSGAIRARHQVEDLYGQGKDSWRI